MLEAALGVDPVGGRLQLPRGGGASVVGRRREARAHRRAPRRVSGCGLARQQVRRGALGRKLRGGGRRLRRHPRSGTQSSGPRVVTIPSDTAAAGEGVSVDRVRRALGRASEGVLQRADWPEPENHSGRGRSRGPKTGVTEALPCRREAPSARARPTSSAPPSLRARGRSRSSCNNPLPLVIVLGVVLGLLIFATVRATWTPVAPLRIGRRRSWGQIISASARMYPSSAQASSWASAFSSSRSRSC